MASRVVIVGGGVVGLCCALRLQREGFGVALVERDPPGESAASASCGFIAVSEVVPLSKPGVFRRAPGWLLRPTGPLSIRPASALGLLPWFLRFAGNARAERIARISRGLAQLTADALQDYESLLGPLGLRHLIRDRPVLELYESEADLARERPHHDARRALGFQVDEISGAEAAEMEPAIARDFEKAVVFRDWRSVVDGKRFVTALTDAFAGAGGVLHRAEVTGLRRDGDGVTGLTLADGGGLDADLVVLAAGAWSKRLAAEVGAKLMLEGVVGYQTTIADPGFAMEHPVVYAKGGFAMTPYESGLAIGGSIEFAGLESRPDWRRAEVLVRKARRVLPGLRSGAGARRIGRRPLTPDTLPVIDRAPRAPNVLIATGHGQLGLTLGATTGKLVAQLATGRTPNLDLAPYRATRF